MMKYFPILIGLAFTFKLSAQPTNTTPLKVGTGDAGKYYDQTLIVTGKVVEVNIRPNIVFLNLDVPHPDSPFTAVIFPKDTNQFGDLKALNGRSVEIKGKVKKYHEKPEIILDHTNQLTVLPSPAAATPAAPPPSAPAAPTATPAMPAKPATTNLSEIL
jgi:DNA/RNA endonuclease YhcR with UshA esterase domain